MAKPDTNSISIAGAYRGATNAQRGEYVNAPGAGSFPGYPNDAYRTYGGFDWATATVGGLWDTMLAEGTLRRARRC